MENKNLRDRGSLYLVPKNSGAIYLVYYLATLYYLVYYRSTFFKHFREFERAHCSWKILFIKREHHSCEGPELRVGMIEDYETP